MREWTKGMAALQGAMFDQPDTEYTHMMEPN